MTTSGAEAFAGSLAPSSAAPDRVAYYDGANGPFYNGYWTAANEYYYSRGPSAPFVRDDGHHYRRAMINGYHPVEGFAVVPVQAGQAQAIVDPARATD